MQIIHIGWGYGATTTGGLDTHITQLTESMAKKGHDIHLFLPSANAPETEHQNITIHPIETESLEPTEQTIRAYNKKIIEESKPLNPDIIHSHDWLGKEAAEQISKEKNIPWIHTVHSLEYMRSAEDKPKPTPIEAIEKCAITKSTRIIAVSRLMETEIQKHYPVHEDKITVIPNHTSGLVPETEREQKTTPVPTILTVSRLSAQKGLEYLIYSSQKIIKRHPKARFIIAGDGDQKQSLETLARLLGVVKSFTFTGFIEKAELEKLMATADIFVMPSIWEPSGIALLDAIEYEIPTLASENTGAIEPFKNLIATHRIRSSKDMTEKIEYMLKDPETKANAKKARHVLDSSGGWNAIAEKTITLYESAISSLSSSSQQ